MFRTRDVLIKYILINIYQEIVLCLMVRGKSWRRAISFREQSSRPPKTIITIVLWIVMVIIVFKLQEYPMEWRKVERYQERPRKWGKAALGSIGMSPTALC